MKKVLKIIANVFLWLIVILALLVTIIVFSSSNSGGVPNIFGFIPLTVESQSMSPTFDEGDLIICKQIDDVKNLKEGDVITFWTLIDGKKVKNTHRIVGINDTGSSISFATRGDNNSLDDDLPAYQSEIIGQWTNIKLSGAGNIMAFLRTKLGFFVCIIIPMALFFLFELYKFIITVISVKNAKNEPQLDEEEIKRRAIEEYLAAQKEKEGSGDKKEEPDKKPDESKSDDSKDKSEPEKKQDENKSDDSKDKSEPEKKPDENKSDDSKDKSESEKKPDENKSDDSKDKSEPEKKPDENKSDTTKKESDNKSDETRRDDKSDDKVSETEEK